MFFVFSYRYISFLWVWANIIIIIVVYVIIIMLMLCCYLLNTSSD